MQNIYRSERKALLTMGIRDIALLASRAVLGGYLAVHGAQKLFGTFGEIPATFGLNRPFTYRSGVSAPLW